MSFIEKWAKSSDWNLICCHQQLTEDLIERYADFFDWKVRVIMFQSLSEEFIERHINRIDPTVVGLFQFLSPEFREKHSITRIAPWLYMSPAEKKQKLKNADSMNVMKTILWRIREYAEIITVT